MFQVNSLRALSSAFLPIIATLVCCVVGLRLQQQTTHSVRVVVAWTGAVADNRDKNWQ